MAGQRQRGTKELATKRNETVRLRRRAAEASMGAHSTKLFRSEPESGAPAATERPAQARRAEREAIHKTRGEEREEKKLEEEEASHHDFRSSSALPAFFRGPLTSWS